MRNLVTLPNTQTPNLPPPYKLNLFSISTAIARLWRVMPVTASGLAQLFQSFKLWKSSEAVFLLLIFTVSFHFSASSQTTTVNINCTGTAGSLNSGYVAGSNGSKSDGTINAQYHSTATNTSNRRGWANFDLSSIPANATIKSVSLRFTLSAAQTSTFENRIYGFLGDPSTMTGAQIWAAVDGTQFHAGSWAGALNATNTFVLNSSATTFIQNNLGSRVNIGFKRHDSGGTNAFAIYGYGGTAAQQPQLQITYSVPITTTTCSATFTDPGGASNYTDNENQTWHFFPATAGNKVRVEFTSFGIEEGWDGLMIYNGSSTAAPVISSGRPAGDDATTCPAGSWRGTDGMHLSPGTITSTAADGSLTFKFTSDNGTVSWGWSANVTCVAPSNFGASPWTVPQTGTI